jgi:hypothetical protein
MAHAPGAGDAAHLTDNIVRGPAGWFIYDNNAVVFA